MSCADGALTMSHQERWIRWERGRGLDPDLDFGPLVRALRIGAPLSRGDPMASILFAVRETDLLHTFNVV
jgi:hypothetical protein